MVSPLPSSSILEAAGLGGAIDARDAGTGAAGSRSWSIPSRSGSAAGRVLPEMGALSSSSKSGSRAGVLATAGERARV